MPALPVMGGWALEGVAGRPASSAVRFPFTAGVAAAAVLAAAAGVVVVVVVVAPPTGGRELTVEAPAAGPTGGGMTGAGGGISCTFGAGIGASGNVDPLMDPTGKSPK